MVIKMIKENIEKLRNLMVENHIDLYYIPTADFHQSEYVGDYFKTRAFLSGFTGSAGTLLVTKDHVYLWTDGRYYLQASEQLKGTEIILMKAGLKDTPTIFEFLKDYQDQTLGFDGRMVSAREVEMFPNKTIKASQDLINEIWIDRPSISCNLAFDYDIRYCGKSRKDKLALIRSQMKDCNSHIITSLDDIAWIFNLRGNDIACNPTVLAYAIIEQEKATLYMQDKAIKADLKKTLKQDNIDVKDYFTFYQDLALLKGKVLLNKDAINYKAYTSLSKEIEIVDQVNPSQLLKSIKNEVEIKNTKNAHIKDGVAMTKFMYWLKHNQTILNEIAISDQLESFRRQQDLFYELSFDTICGYQEHGAIIHYKATPETTIDVKLEGLLLIDSGGQYLDGTTDITRTFVMGPITKEQSQDFTTVLKANLHLQHAIFDKNTTGNDLDHYARKVIQDYGLDYNHGTGHGIGHFLCVHEGPQSIRPKTDVRKSAYMAPGMITSNEPGIYKEGKHGIRLENEILCVEKESHLAFEVITYCPFDMDAIDFSMLDETETKQLDDYHQLVYHTLAPFLTVEEKNWLKDFIQHA